MRRGDMADHSHPLTPLKLIALQVAPIPNQAFKSDKIFCREKHSNLAPCIDVYSHQAILQQSISFLLLCITVVTYGISDLLKTLERGSNHENFSLFTLPRSQCKMR